MPRKVWHIHPPSLGPLAGAEDLVFGKFMLLASGLPTRPILVESDRLVGGGMVGSKSQNGDSNYACSEIYLSSDLQRA